jgi:hypothetical protein
LEGTLATLLEDNPFGISQHGTLADDTGNMSALDLCDLLCLKKRLGV